MSKGDLKPRVESLATRHFQLIDLYGEENNFLRDMIHSCHHDESMSLIEEYECRRGINAEILQYRKMFT